MLRLADFAGLRLRRSAAPRSHRFSARHLIFVTDLRVDRRRGRLESPNHCLTGQDT
jgi:hypothetical protein